ncbi:MAG: hypothetical protein II732_01060, partial [Lachnospiraceae bacterium]|nr:hypothetical protein [Lachnospiraceae bacterium]
MAQRTDIHKVLIIGSGPIIIGQRIYTWDDGTRENPVINEGDRSFYQKAQSYFNHGANELH